MGGIKLKLMFEGEDCQALQTLIDNQTILLDAQLITAPAHKAIQTVIKEDVHFWHYHDQLLSDLCQLPDEGIHSLSNRINTLISKCRFLIEEIKEAMKIMALQYAVKCHEARDVIHLQDQDTLTYKSLLNHCKQLEAQCEQFKQAQAQGRAHLTSITAASASHSSLHANTQSTTTRQACQRCDNSHPHANCPAFDHECYNCHGTGHLTALCKRPHANRHPVDNSSKHRELRGRSHRSSNHKQSSRSTEAGNLTKTPSQLQKKYQLQTQPITRP